MNLNRTSAPPVGLKIYRSEIFSVAAQGQEKEKEALSRTDSSNSTASSCSSVSSVHEHKIDQSHRVVYYIQPFVEIDLSKRQKYKKVELKYNKKYLLH